VLVQKTISNLKDENVWQALVPQLWQNFKNWSIHKWTTPYWAFFMINDGSKVNFKVM
jgi:hypothetical protein